MERLNKIATYSEIIASVAVVLSLVYVGAQIRQNTKATQANTAQSLYSMHSQRLLLVYQDPDLSELSLRAQMRPLELTAVDTLRLNADLNLGINVFEAAFTNGENGTLEREMAESWLKGLDTWVCKPLARPYWNRVKSEYVSGFVDLVERSMSQTDCVQ
jgi:hypothetical protein